ncbi:MAG: methylenetetrahydrofolate reductase [Oligoflexia bacterium]|nr:methylenetetrahydrofolate reductase [Oligoflexia bacterium]
MTSLPFRPDRKLTEVLAQGRFTFSAEVIPPRNGTEQAKVLEQIDALIRAGAEFLAVTKGAGGSLRGGSLPIAQAIKERFAVPCIAHFTCRDLTPHEVENSLMDHHYFGIRNILALRGDPPDGQPEWRPRDGGYNFAHELISQIRAMNEGRYLHRAGGPPVSEVPEPTEFCVGAAAYPEFPDPAQRIEFFRLKAEAGAHYGVTDMLFDPEAYARFRDQCAGTGIRIPILPGTRVLKSRAQAERMAAKFRVSIPPPSLAALPEGDSPDGIERGVELFLKLTERLRALGAPGIHLFVISDTPAASLALTRLAAGRKEGKS